VRGFETEGSIQDSDRLRVQLRFQWGELEGSIEIFYRPDSSWGFDSW